MLSVSIWKKKNFSCHTSVTIYKPPPHPSLPLSLCTAFMNLIITKSSVQDNFDLQILRLGAPVVTASLVHIFKFNFYLRQNSLDIEDGSDASIA